ncbi:MAG: signal peptide peptidase SppA, partial [Tannerella sp.]|nr:signal peptide peptidase SppA [Tannerella sp.]
STLGVIIGSVIVSLLGFIIFVGIAATMDSSSSFKLQKNTVLRLNLKDASISDRESSSPFDFILNPSGKSLMLSDILSAIRKAEKNDNIKGIYLNAEVPAHYATMEPIRNALLKFKESGKFIIAYGDDFSQSAYYLSSVADSIFMNPLGILDFGGLSRTTQFNKGVYEKWGVEYQVYKVGTYKSAVEPFIEEKMSDANRAQVTSYLNDTWETVLKGISESRGIPVEQLNLYADEHLFFTDPEKIVEYQLLDGLKYANEVDSCLKNLLALKDSEKLRFANVGDMASVKETGKKSNKDKIAVLYAEGEIRSGESAGFMPGGNISAKEYVKELYRLKDDKNVKAVVFRVNSPGGSMDEAEQIWNAVKELKAVKPVVVSMGTYAASGGYYISCNADKIIAEPTTITGSIGVFSLIPNGAQLAKKMGATFDAVSTNKLSDFATNAPYIPFIGVGLPVLSRPLTDVESAKMQVYTEKAYDLFLTRCADGRGKTKAEIDSIGQGRVWTGRQALELGLVDALGGMDLAVSTAAGLAELENYSVSEYPAKKDFFMSLLEGSSESISARIWSSIIGRESYQQKQMLNAWQNYDVRQAIMPEFINQ